MNEKLQYASMIEMPIDTCTITQITRKKKRVKKNKLQEEQVKEQLINKINLDQEEQVENLLGQGAEENAYNNEQFESQNQEQNSVSVYESAKPTKKPFKVTVIGVQLVVIGLLVATILLTNALFADSGINVFLRGVFSTEVEQTDARTQYDFAPVIAMGNNEELSLEQGVISFEGQGSVYSPCEGEVISVTQMEDGTFDIEIMHSDNFKSVISGMEYVYVEQGQTVYKTIPVGYLEANGAKVCFNDGQGQVITNYQIEDGLVKWLA